MGTMEFSPLLCIQRSKDGMVQQCDPPTESPLRVVQGSVHRDQGVIEASQGKQRKTTGGSGVLG